ncbi:MAG: hypothetical protein EBU80_11945, partial [Chitinophagia bacterium]|nr:hypothetical protein [Chitinophagia bacterium]
MSIILRDSERCISGKLPIEQWDIYGNSRINKLIIQDIDTDILDLSVLPDHIVDIVIFNSRIKKLILPEELMECNVKGVQLEEIVVNKELTSLICDNNNLTHLHVPDSIEWLIAGNNRLTTIT